MGLLSPPYLIKCPFSILAHRFNYLTRKSESIEMELHHSILLFHRTIGVGEGDRPVTELLAKPHGYIRGGVHFLSLLDDRRRRETIIEQQHHVDSLGVTDIVCLQLYNALDQL